MNTDTLTLTNTGTINGLDAIDATSETTIESAIDTLANLTSVQGQTFTLAGALITSGANSLTLTTTGATNVTLPTTGTLATLAGAEALTTNDETQTKKNIEEPTKTTAESLTFVKLINVAKIKGDLNKKYFDKVVDINANILLCRDDENIIELYYGPFLEDSLRDDLLSKLIKNGFKESYSLEMTKEEFDKRCNY